MEVDLFGEKVDEFKSAKERYGIFPTTVWKCNMSDAVTRRMKKAVGDDGSARAGCLHNGPGGKAGAIWDSTASIFNPAVACWILNMFAPKQGVCFDPFAGGGTRAIFAAKRAVSLYVARRKNRRGT